MAVTDPTPTPDVVTAPRQYFGQTVSSICSLLARPIVLTGFMRDFMVRHFQEGNIEEPALRHLVWRNALTTNILIESIHRWRPQLTESRPAVIIKRNAYSNRRVGIGDRMQGNPADRVGDPHFATYWMGSHTLFCIGATGAQAELLGTEVQRELCQYTYLIQQALGLHRFQVTDVGEIGELEESTENFVVPVTVGYAFEDRWVLQQQAPPLSSVSLSMILEC